MFYFLNKDFWYNPWLVVAFVSTLVVIIFLRYFTFAVVYGKILTRLKKLESSRLWFSNLQIRREIRWSFLSSLICTLFSAPCFWAYQQGLTKIYTTLSDYSIVYLVVSPLMILILYETYYYWLHRVLHLPAIFKIVHKAHHESIHPTVFTSFAFHPIEASLQFIFFPIVIFFVPLHYSILLGVLMLMTVSAVINHSGVEIFHNRLLLKHLIGSSHHNHHHAEFKTNFGLYFTWWDKWMKTESKQ